MSLSILQLPASHHEGLTFNRPPEIWGGFIGQARLHLANADLLGRFPSDFSFYAQEYINGISRNW